MQCQNSYTILLKIDHKINLQKKEHVTIKQTTESITRNNAITSLEDRHRGFRTRKTFLNFQILLTNTSVVFFYYLADFI